MPNWEAVCAAFAEHYPEVMTILDRRGRVLFTNRRLLGVPPGAPRDTPIYDSLLPAHAARLRASLRRVFRTGTAGRYEVARSLTGERTAWEEHRVLPVKRGGRIVAAILVTTDVSVRKRAQRELREHRAQHQTLFRSFPLPTYAWKRRGDEFVLVDFNDAGAAITRGGVEKHVGKTVTEMYPDRSDVQADMARCFAERVTISREMDYRFRSTSEVRRLQVTFGFVPPDGVVVHTEDITARKLAEEALRESEEALRSRARREATIAELGQRALSGLALDTLMSEATAAIARALDVEFCKVLELLADGKALLLRAGTGWRAGHVGRATVPAGAGSQAGYTLLAEKPVIVDDLASEQRFRGPPLLVEHGVVSGMSVPIPGERRPYGVLGAHTTRRRQFAEDDAQFLQAIANILATAIIRRRGEDIRDQLLGRMLSVQEEERRRIARELHDEAGQAITSLLIGLRAVQDAPNLGEARANASRLRTVAAQVLEDIGRLVEDLHPRALDDLGLVPAAARYVREHARLYGVDVKLDMATMESERFSRAVETALYRIIQEALTNIARHAAARTVGIALRRLGPDVELVVRDDGQGFDRRTLPGHDAPARHLGLLGIRERASRLGGSVEIDTGPDRGTTITVRIPAGPRDDAAEDAPGLD